MAPQVPSCKLLAVGTGQASTEGEEPASPVAGTDPTAVACIIATGLHSAAAASCLEDRSVATFQSGQSSVSGSPALSSDGCGSAAQPKAAPEQVASADEQQQQPTDDACPVPSGPAPSHSGDSSQQLQRQSESVGCKEEAKVEALAEAGQQSCRGDREDVERGAGDGIAPAQQLQVQVEQQVELPPAQPADTRDDAAQSEQWHKQVLAQRLSQRCTLGGGALLHGTPESSTAAPGEAPSAGQQVPLPSPRWMTDPGDGKTVTTGTTPASEQERQQQVQTRSPLAYVSAVSVAHILPAASGGDCSPALPSGCDTPGWSTFSPDSTPGSTAESSAGSASSASSGVCAPAAGGTAQAPSCSAGPRPRSSTAATTPATACSGGNPTAEGESCATGATPPHRVSASTLVGAPPSHRGTATTLDGASSHRSTASSLMWSTATYPTAAAAPPADGAAPRIEQLMSTDVAEPLPVPVRPSASGVADSLPIPSGGSFRIYQGLPLQEEEEGQEEQQDQNGVAPQVPPEQEAVQATTSAPLRAEDSAAFHELEALLHSWKEREVSSPSSPAPAAAPLPALPALTLRVVTSRAPASDAPSPFPQAASPAAMPSALQAMTSTSYTPSVSLARAAALAAAARAGQRQGSQGSPAVEPSPHYQPHYQPQLGAEAHEMLRQAAAASAAAAEHDVMEAAGSPRCTDSGAFDAAALDELEVFKGPACGCTCGECCVGSGARLLPGSKAGPRSGSAGSGAPTRPGVAEQTEQQQQGAGEQQHEEERGQAAVRCQGCSISGMCTTRDLITKLRLTAEAAAATTAATHAALAASGFGTPCSPRSPALAATPASPAPVPAPAPVGAPAAVAAETAAAVFAAPYSPMYAPHSPAYAPHSPAHAPRSRLSAAAAAAAMTPLSSAGASPSMGPVAARRHAPPPPGASGLGLPPPILPLHPAVARPAEGGHSKPPRNGSGSDTVPATAAVAALLRGSMDCPVATSLLPPIASPIRAAAPAPTPEGTASGAIPPTPTHSDCTGTGSDCGTGRGRLSMVPRSPITTGFSGSAGGASGTPDFSTGCSTPRDWRKLLGGDSYASSAGRSDVEIELPVPNCLYGKVIGILYDEAGDAVACVQVNRAQEGGAAAAAGAGAGPGAASGSRLRWGSSASATAAVPPVLQGHPSGRGAPAVGMELHAEVEAQDSQQQQQQQQQPQQCRAEAAPVQGTEGEVSQPGSPAGEQQPHPPSVFAAAGSGALEDDETDDEGPEGLEGLGLSPEDLALAVSGEELLAVLESRLSWEALDWRPLRQVWSAAPGGLRQRSIRGAALCAPVAPAVLGEAGCAGAAGGEQGGAEAGELGAEAEVEGQGEALERDALSTTGSFAAPSEASWARLGDALSWQPLRMRVTWHPAPRGGGDISTP